MNEHTSGEDAAPESNQTGVPLRRRIPFGPSQQGMSGWSPMPHLSTRGPTTVVGEEANEIARTLSDRGPLSRRGLQIAVGARYWGPLRFGQALRYALEHGLIRRVGRETFAAPERAPGEKKEESDGAQQ